MKRTFAVGDIHGAFRALQQVLERAGVRQKDRLIFLGDLVDGWSQSFEVIQFLLELENKFQCIFLRGNHDIWCQQWLETGATNDVWLFSGGLATIESYNQASETDKLNHLRFFRRMPDYHIGEHNRLFVHAGFCSQQGPQKERCSTNYSWDRTLWEMALCMDERIKKDSLLYPKRLKLFNEIFIGHTPTLFHNSFDPLNAMNVWNLDTGAAFYGHLSIMDVGSKQFWQSDVVQDLYPYEKGRNNH